MANGLVAEPQADFSGLNIWGDPQGSPQDGGAASPYGGMGAGGYAPAVMDEETRRRLMMQVGLPSIAANMGAALMAASQRGLTPEQRAHYMAQVGRAPVQGMQDAAAAGQAMEQAQSRQAQARYMEAQARVLQMREQRELAQENDWRASTGRPPLVIPGMPGQPGAIAATTQPQGAPARGGAMPPLPTSTAPLGPPGELPTQSPQDLDLAARMLYAEANGQPVEGQTAAAQVMLNRSRLTGRPLTEIITAPSAFQPWAQRRAEVQAYRPEQYAQQRQILDGLISGQIRPPTGTENATHFLNPEATRQQRGDGQLPEWAQGEGTRVGAHVFHTRPGDFVHGGGANGGRAPGTDPNIVPAQAGGQGGWQPGGPPPIQRQIINDPTAFFSSLPEAERAFVQRMGRERGTAYLAERFRNQRRYITPEERTQFQLPPDRPYFMDRDGMPHAVEPNRVTAGDHGARLSAEAAQKRVTDAGVASDAEARTFLPILQDYRAISGTVAAGGPLTAATLPFRQVAAQLGAMTEEGARTAGIETVMRALETRMAPAMRAAGSGTMSDNDVKLFFSSLPTLSMTPEGREMVASMMERAIQYRQRHTELMSEFARQNGHLDGFEAFARQRMPPTLQAIPRVRSLAELEAVPDGTLTIIDNATIREAVRPPGAPATQGPMMYVVRRRQPQ